ALISVPAPVGADSISARNALHPSFAVANATFPRGEGHRRQSDRTPPLQRTKLNFNKMNKNTY
ncbi:MAG: hypothetical protein IKD01_03835, partial [Oscillospiraceae bacterium]|nr:hypothetical protein [Oscillospiraceae bacterium]